MNPSIVKPDGGPATKPSKSVELDEAVVCDGCGWYGVHRLGDHILCLDCYAERGSCRPELGKDDLWIFPDEEQVPDRGAVER